RLALARDLRGAVALAVQHRQHVATRAAEHRQGRAVEAHRMLRPVPPARTHRAPPVSAAMLAAVRSMRLAIRQVSQANNHARAAALASAGVGSSHSSAAITAAPLVRAWRSSTTCSRAGFSPTGPWGSRSGSAIVVMSILLVRVGHGPGRGGVA